MEDTTCQVCGAQYDEETKMFRISSGALVSPDFMHSRICGYAKDNGKQGCRNTTGAYNPEYGWIGFAPPSEGSNQAAS